jgi:hypothetical protein
MSVFRNENAAARSSRNTRQLEKCFKTKKGSAAGALVEEILD